MTYQHVLEDSNTQEILYYSNLADLYYDFPEVEMFHEDFGMGQIGHVGNGFYYHGYLQVNYENN